jgi:hypothetical protein
LREYPKQYSSNWTTKVKKMILRKLLSTASVLALLAGPISVFADETGGAMAGGAADS